MVKIGTFNVRGMRDRTKRLKLFEWLHVYNLDIIVLQEINILNINEGRIWAREWGGRAYWSFAISFPSGVGILLHPKFQGQIISFQSFLLPNLEFILLGDFNCVSDYILDKHDTGQKYHSHSTFGSALLNDNCSNVGLKDVYREHQPTLTLCPPFAIHALVFYRTKCHSPLYARRGVYGVTAKRVYTRFE